MRQTRPSCAVEASSLGGGLAARTKEIVMPQHKDLKRLVRTRMAKTGESYTAARAQLVRTSPPAAQFAEIAGMSDAAVQAQTGRTWKQWVSELDAVGSVGLTHRDIAKHVHEAHGVSSWWSQAVTVGYERIRGLREIGQRRDGRYEASKSKTFAVTVSRLYRAFSVKRTRDRWLPGVDLRVRTSIVDKSMRISWPDGTSVHALFVAKGPRKSQLAVQHVGLARKQDGERAKAYWAERFAELAAILAPGPSKAP
jgi:hypothetical protein